MILTKLGHIFLNMDKNCLNIGDLYLVFKVHELRILKNGLPALYLLYFMYGWLVLDQTCTDKGK